MSVVINTNIAASLASRNLSYTSEMLRRSLHRISSGSRIITASDDAGGVAVAMKLSAAATRSAAVSTNIANATSYLQMQNSTLTTAGRVLDRMSELWSLYQDPTKSSSDKDNYDTEFKDLQKQLASLSAGTFNGIAIFGSSGSGVPETVRVSEDGEQTVELTAKDFTNPTSGVGTLADTAGSGSLASTVLATITSAIENVGTMRANAGAEESRLSFASEVVTTNRINLEAATSRILDVDVAEETTNLAHWNVLVESGAAMLAQANQSAQTALRLIQ